MSTSITSKTFGYAVGDSTSRSVNVVVKRQLDGNFIENAVGRMMYAIQEVDGREYLAIGTVHEVTTGNAMMEARVEGTVALHGATNDSGREDIRRTSFNLQSVFVKDEDGKWQKSAPHLPTSVSTGLPVYHLDDETVLKLVDEGVDFPSVGTFRGMEGSPQPLDIPDFGGARGAYHTGVIGRSGSGKTFLSSMLMCSSMKHEQQALLMIDPQGQWGNENGMSLSPQKFARGLGREVRVVRISEDVKLPWDQELFSSMVTYLKVWKKGFRRMGSENMEAFSDIVSSMLHRKGQRCMDEDSRTLLTSIFKAIADSPSLLSRIYASQERRDTLQEELLILAGEESSIESPDGVQGLVSEETAADTEEAWANILSFFSPLQNLFSSKNLEGGARSPLDGPNGVLTHLFQVRNEKSAPAPYVIFDMSPSVAVNARRSLNSNDKSHVMQQILDDENVKAIILMSVLDEVKQAAEVAYATTGGNLNTQIGFDEAWRFAPEKSDNEHIQALSDKLKGFALDTRKFGIGWTYILQSPEDLRKGIWKQLSYVYAGWGLIGADLKRLEELSEDSNQMSLYRSFISPASTGKYPFMIMGSISPIIFTAVPAFINAYNSPEEFLAHNSAWITKILHKRSLPTITAESVIPTPTHGTATVKAAAPSRSYTVGGTSVSPASKPQSTRQVEVEEPPEDPIFGKQPF